MNRSRQLAGFISKLRLEDLPRENPDFLKLCLLDHFGCALGALGTEEAGVCLRSVQAVSGSGNSTIVGQDFGADPATAALTNGILSHVLIFDDLHRKSKLHPGVAVIPAALAACELIGADGKTFLEAISAGYETAARLGMAVNMAEHRLKGWRATGTCGSFGAAAAASRAMGHSPETLHNALAAAAGQASGNFAFTQGSGMELYLAAGTAARNGVVSALLAEGGFKGSADPLEAPDGGFFSMTTKDPKPEILTDGLGERYWLMDTSIKLYPTCHSSQTGIDAALLAREKHGVRIEDVERTSIRAGEITKIQCGWDYEPGPPAKMIFHMGYAMAVALRRGRVSPSDLEGESLYDPELVRFAKATQVDADPELTAIYHEKKPCDVTFHLNNGERIHERVEYCRGDPENRPTAEVVVEKFRDLTASALGPESQEAFIDFVMNIEEQPNLSRLNELTTHGETQTVSN